MSADMQEADQLKKEVREMELELARLGATFPVSEVRPFLEASVNIPLTQLMLRLYSTLAEDHG